MVGRGTYYPLVIAAAVFAVAVSDGAHRYRNRRFRNAIAGFRLSAVRVLVPNIYPGFLTGGLFAFLASFDNYPISMFLTDVRNKTLPIQMLQYLEESPDPTLAAISTILILITVTVLVVCDRLVGLRTLGSF